jgi:hypothetical protein
MLDRRRQARLFLQGAIWNSYAERVTLSVAAQWRSPRSRPVFENPLIVTGIVVLVSFVILAALPFHWQD